MLGHQWASRLQGGSVAPSTEPGIALARGAPPSGEAEASGAGGGASAFGAPSSFFTSWARERAEPPAAGSVQAGEHTAAPPPASFFTSWARADKHQGQPPVAPAHVEERTDPTGAGLGQAGVHPAAPPAAGPASFSTSWARPEECAHLQSVGPPQMEHTAAAPPATGPASFFTSWARAGEGVEEQTAEQRQAAQHAWGSATRTPDASLLPTSGNNSGEGAPLHTAAPTPPSTSFLPAWGIAKDDDLAAEAAAAARATAAALPAAPTPPSTSFLPAWGIGRNDDPAAEAAAEPAATVTPSHVPGGTSFLTAWGVMPPLARQGGEREGGWTAGASGSGSECAAGAVSRGPSRVPLTGAALRQHQLALGEQGGWPGHDAYLCVIERV